VCFTRTPWYTRLPKSVGTEGMERALEKFSESIEYLEEVVKEETNSLPLYTRLGRKQASI